MSDKKEAIYNSGKELFSDKGFKDTNVAEIAKMAGIATGTFYNYYASKDQLFMEIYLEENKKLKEQIIESIDLEAEPMAVVMEMMNLNYQGMSDHPILKEWYTRDVFMKIEQNFREQNGLEQVDFLYDSFIKVVEKWQRERKMRNDISAEMIMAIFLALINIDTHKEEIGIQYFPKILEHLYHFTMNGLCDN